MVWGQTISTLVVKGLINIKNLYIKEPLAFNETCTFIFVHFHFIAIACVDVAVATSKVLSSNVN